MIKERLNRLHQEISELEENYLNKRGIMQKELINIFIDLVKEAKKDNSKIKEACYKIASFIQYDFDREIEEIIELAGELELPNKHISGDANKKWEELKNLIVKLQEYEK